jgi:hypothetical protein
MNLKPYIKHLNTHGVLSSCFLRKKFKLEHKAAIEILQGIADGYSNVYFKNKNQIEVR